MINMSTKGGARMSDQSKQIRIKRRRIRNIIHNVTWIAESLTILAAVVFEITMDAAFHQGPMLIQSASVFFLSNMVFFKISTPFLHLFNEQRIKVIVLEHGWVCAMKAALNINSSFRSTEPNRRNSPLEQHTASSFSRVHAFEKLETTKKNNIMVDRIYNRTQSSPIKPQVVPNYDHHDVLYPPNMETSDRDNIASLPNIVNRY